VDFSRGRGFDFSAEARLKSFADVLTTQLRTVALKRSVSAFLFAAFAFFAGYFAFNFGSADAQARAILATVQLESQITGRMSQEVKTDIQRFCRAFNCQRATVLHKDTHIIEYSFPDEDSAGATGILSTRADFAVAWPSQAFQLRWNAPDAILLVRIGFWELLRLPVLVLALLAATAIGFVLAIQSSGRQVSLLLGKELNALTSISDAAYAAPPEFHTLEGRAVYRILLEQRERLLALTEVEAENRNNRELAALASQIAHDVRSPLTALSTLIGASSGMDEGRTNLLRSVIERINGIADSLLGQSRELRSRSRAPAVHPISNLIRVVVDERETLLDRRIRLEISIAENLHAICEPNELGRVLSNLMANAAEAISTGGRIRVTATANAQTAVLTIADNGCGIPRELMPRLTERGATFGKPNGNGLGLYHAKIAVQSWRGELKIESEEGQGTSVQIVLRTNPA
jgi:signal transduction histidine kinase